VRAACAGSANKLKTLLKSGLVCRGERVICIVIIAVFGDSVFTGLTTRIPQTVYCYRGSTSEHIRFSFF